MINAQEALHIILHTTRPLGSEKVRLSDALGRTLAEDVVADENISPFDNSSMDGFALVSGDLGKAAEKRVELEVVGESRAGKPFGKSVRSGQAVRIMTGGVVPEGADAIVPIERVEMIDDSHAAFISPVGPGENIRRAGEDVKKGEIALKAGLLITPARLGVLASLGRRKVRVGICPRVNILPTGDELVEIDQKLEEGKIRNSNSYMLAAYVRESGGLPEPLGVVPDKKKRLRKEIKEGLDCDVLLITGGVSVGKYDLVKDVLERIGVEIKFWRVNIKPGKPLLFGTIDETLVFGLPGNPASASVTFLQFVRPAIHRMLGRRESGGVSVLAKMEHDFSKSDGKRHYLRGIVEQENGELRVRTTGTQSSGVLSSMAKANCLILIPESATSLRRGDPVEVELLRLDSRGSSSGLTQD